MKPLLSSPHTVAPQHPKAIPSPPQPTPAHPSSLCAWHTAQCSLVTAAARLCNVRNFGHEHRLSSTQDIGEIAVTLSHTPDIGCPNGYISWIAHQNRGVAIHSTFRLSPGRPPSPREGCRKNGAIPLCSALAATHFRIPVHIAL